MTEHESGLTGKALAEHQFRLGGRHSFTYHGEEHAREFKRLVEEDDKARREAADALFPLVLFGIGLVVLDNLLKNPTVRLVIMAVLACWGIYLGYRLLKASAVLIKWLWDAILWLRDAALALAHLLQDLWSMLGRWRNRPGRSVGRIGFPREYFETGASGPIRVELPDKAWLHLRAGESIPGGQPTKGVTLILVRGERQTSAWEHSAYRTYETAYDVVFTSKRGGYRKSVFSVTVDGPLPGMRWTAPESYDDPRLALDAARYYARAILAHRSHNVARFNPSKHTDD